MESTNSNASESSNRHQNVRIKHLKNNEVSLSDSESTEFEVVSIKKTLVRLLNY